jgi:hypothetical protein
LETTATGGPTTVADVKLTFSVYKEFCQPAGVRLEISGTEGWGPLGHGEVRIVFNHDAVSVSDNRAWFGNTSGVALGFDWSDAAMSTPRS